MCPPWNRPSVMATYRENFAILQKILLYQNIIAVSDVMYYIINLYNLLGSTVHPAWCYWSEILHKTPTFSPYWIFWRAVQVGTNVQCQ